MDPRAVATLERLHARGPRSGAARSLVAPLACALGVVLSGCAGTAPTTSPAPPEQTRADANGAAPARPAGNAAAAAAGPVSTELKTRNALFKASRFAELPGWSSDDLITAWDAFRSSCKALEQRDAWKPVCADATRVARNTADVRRFFESQFALFRMLNADATGDGEVTGYYEPLLAGSLRAEGAYTVPVYGIPNDLYTLDWKLLTSAQRHGLVSLAPRGRELVVAAPRQAGSFVLDATRFDADSRDRRWRVRLEGERALPYRTRSEIESLGRLDAPVIAWVEDALALYAMQVQGSGRIVLPDGRVLRLQYAQQNGHPFRPLRLAVKASERIVTRGGAAGAEGPEHFVLSADAGIDPPADATRIEAPIVTRGARPAPANPAAPTAAKTPRDDALVDQLLSQGNAKTASAPARTRAATAAPTPAAARPTRVPALDSDPSYVFFRIAPDQTTGSGPVGALGVPLTPGRSIAVDPRTTPMGYPVYLSAPTPPGSTIALQRLVMAQDTGGAIRGAIRADFFWGFGSTAGRQALRTRERGQMWLMLPRSEADRLQSGGLVTRGSRIARAAATGPGECLIDDETFCSEPD